MNIFVGKLNFRTNESSLRELFEEYGEVTSAKIIMDKFSGRSRGFAFVEMPSDEEANQAIQELNGSEFDGMSIVVNEARPRDERPSRGPRSRY